MAIKTYGPIDPTPLARTLVLWIWIDLASNLVAGAATLYHARALAELPPDTPVSFWDGLPVLGQADTIAFLGIAPAIASLLVAGFLSLKWIYRVNRNAHTFARGLTVRPAWAVGWFFVPFANLLMPFRGVAQAWRATTEPSRWKEASLPSTLRLWWGLWLVFGLVDNASFRVELRATDLQTLAAADYLTILASAIRVPLDLVFMRMVRNLTAMQASALHRQTFS